MSQMSIDQVLAQIRAVQGQIGAKPRPAAASDEVQGPGFAEMLKRGIDDVNRKQQHASQLVDRFERGDPTVELSSVMVEMQKASVSFRALTEVRNRFISAYQDIMNMPI